MLRHEMLHRVAIVRCCINDLSPVRNQPRACATLNDVSKLQ